MTENPHADYIRKQIISIQAGSKFATYVINTSHDEFIRDFSSCLFTNLVRNTFTRTYMRKHLCRCGAPSNERCHGLNEERPVLIRRALERVYPDVEQSIQLKVIVVAFLEEHINTKFAFKCSPCHKLETFNLLTKASLTRSGRRYSYYGS